MSANVSNTYGAVTIGALSASLLSGAVAIQTILYYKLYPSDSIRVKILVSLAYAFTVIRLTLVTLTGLRHMATRSKSHLLRLGVAMGHDCYPLWQDRYYTLEYRGDDRDYGSFDVSSTLARSTLMQPRSRLTGLSGQLLRLSDIHAKRNWFLTCPILILAAFRLASACVTASEMLRLQTYSAFKQDFRWVFTLGLALSSAVDILITGSLFGLLHTSRSDAENLKAVIDSLILYTFETGSLTCAATIIDMICWITMSSNLIFMGLHFVIGKLYANSLLVTLNTRRGLRRGGPSYSAGSAILLDSRRPSDRIVADPELAKRAELQINVERSIHYSTDYNVKLAPRGVTSQQSISAGSIR
ncbi:hypothetical protein F5146DRAFT_1144829 [Armillaria mellea]|nr:hypothetical protein F5146DRAFT_1144829 [Armillaria mellea]